MIYASFRPALYTFLLLVLGISFQGCLKDKCDSTRTFVRFTPVYLTVDEIRQDVSFENSRELKNPGKIYFHHNYIFINEIRTGIHIIDNADPENPVNVGFIKIPGNVDIAVKDNILYADNYIDLLSVKIDDPLNPQLVKRTENVFNSISQHEDLGHLVYYEQTEETVEIDCQDPKFGQDFWGWGPDIFVDVTFSSDAEVSGGAGGGANVSVGGSLARFTTYEDYLYTIDSWRLHVFDISNLSCPELANTVDVGWGIETLFPLEDKLFIGSQSGMFIFDNSNPENPTMLSVFNHARACDPVVVEGDIAYVTLRDGTACEGFNNQLDVLDVSDLTNPTLIKTYPMDNPHGLAVRDNILYLCEGDFGLKVFDVENSLEIDNNQLAHLKHFSTYDAISLPNNTLLVIGEDGFYQFDSTDPSNLKELSVISVSK